MALEFPCSKCRSAIIVRFLKIGEVAKCPSCGAHVPVPGDAEEIQGSDENRKKIDTFEDTNQIGDFGSQTETVGENKTVQKGGRDTPWGVGILVFVTGIAIGAYFTFAAYSGDPESVQGIVEGLAEEEGFLIDPTRAIRAFWLLAAFGYGVAALGVWALKGIKSTTGKQQQAPFIIGKAFQRHIRHYLTLYSVLAMLGIVLIWYIDLMWMLSFYLTVHLIFAGLFVLISALFYWKKRMGFFWHFVSLIPYLLMAFSGGLVMLMVLRNALYIEELYRVLIWAAVYFCYAAVYLAWWHQVQVGQAWPRLVDRLQKNRRNSDLFFDYRLYLSGLPFPFNIAGVVEGTSEGGVVSNILHALIPGVCAYGLYHLLPVSPSLLKLLSFFFADVILSFFCFIIGVAAVGSFYWFVRSMLEAWALRPYVTDYAFALYPRGARPRRPRYQGIFNEEGNLVRIDTVK